MRHKIIAVRIRGQRETILQVFVAVAPLALSKAPYGQAGTLCRGKGGLVAQGQRIQRTVLAILSQ